MPENTQSTRANQDDGEELQILSNLDISIEELEQRLELSTTMRLDSLISTGFSLICGLNACLLNCC